jgi:acetolactate synthase-1/2/3 large subunit
MIVLMKVADFIVDFYQKQKIDKAFLVYGAANGDLVDAFTRNTEIEYVCTFHEQAAGFAAEGYQKLKNIPGLAISTSGPGATNMITSIANCFYESIPCIFISGQINSKFLRPNDRIRQVGFQETDFISLVKPITKYAVSIRDPKDVLYELEKSFYLATEGRCGPVVIDLPIDVQKAEIDKNTLIGFNEDVFQRKFDLNIVKKKIENYFNDLKSAKRPTLLIGGGVKITNNIEKLNKILKKLKIPAFVTWNAIDVVCSDQKYYGGRVGTYGGPGRNFGIQNTDLIFIIGSRVSGRLTGGNVSSFIRGAKKYITDIDSEMLDKKFQQLIFDENILCDLNNFLNIFENVLDENLENLPNFDIWNKKVVEWRDKYDPILENAPKENTYSFRGKNFVNPYYFMKILSEKMNKSDVIVGDCGGCSVLVGHALKTKHGQYYHSNNSHAPMGYSFSAAIGSALATERRVICLTGDGGFNMNIQELQTLNNYNIKNLKTFIINNHIYGITKAFQKTNFQGREEACGPKGYNPPDFNKIVKAYGVESILIENDDQVEEKIDKALNSKGAVVVDVNCHEYHIYEPRLIGWATPIEDMYPYLERSEFKKNMYIEPLDNWKNPFMPSVKIKSETME